MGVTDRMREDWDRRAREDAFYFAAFGRQRQDDHEFLASASDVVPTLECELVRLPPARTSERRALEIGCGPGRLMLPMSRHFGEIHGVDISQEMAALARERLCGVPRAHVHVVGGDGSLPFPEGYFDFVYSYIVFQHIPDAEVVLRYLGESRRVLKPGGVLCCQLRGAPPLASEMDREAATWTGCHFSGEDMAAFARASDFHLVALSGIDTQYMWTTWLKPVVGRAFLPAAGLPAGRTGPKPGPQPERAAPLFTTTLKAVTASNSGETRVPARGPDAVVSLWIDGLPKFCHLGNLDAAFHEICARGCYLSPITESGGCQMNVRLPDGLPPGPAPVTLCFEGRAIGDPKTIEVLAPPPRAPRVLSVSDGLNIESKNRIVMGGVKVTIEDVENPEEFSFTVDGLPALYEQFECKDPITSRYEFAFLVSPRTRLGERTLDVRKSGAGFASLAVEIAGLPDFPAPASR
jgi:SAM-dependent methyltransferase